MDLGLKGRSALVTAASRGLGRACAEALIGEGAEVFISSRDEASIASTAKQIKAAGWLAADVSKPGEPEAANGSAVPLHVVARGALESLAARADELKARHVAAKCAGDVVMLAVDVVGNRASDGDKLGAWRDGHVTRDPGPATTIRPPVGAALRVNDQIERVAGTDRCDVGLAARAPHHRRAQIPASRDWTC